MRVPVISLPRKWRFLQREEHLLLQRRYDLEAARAKVAPAGDLLARCDADDAVLARLPDGRFVLAHLTWADDESWPPHMLFFTDLNDALEAMRDDKAER